VRRAVKAVHRQVGDESSIVCKRRSERRTRTESGIGAAESIAQTSILAALIFPFSKGGTAPQVCSLDLFRPQRHSPTASIGTRRVAQRV
jgi:hypothetical protein